MGQPRILRSLEEKVLPAHTALLIIDMIKDLCDPQGAAAKAAGRNLTGYEPMIPCLQRFLSACREQGLLIVHVQVTTLPGGASDSGPWLDVRSRASQGDTPLGIEGTWGHEIIDEVAPREGELVIRKFRYSAFVGTSLDLVLRAHAIKTVIVTGVSTQNCIESTVRDALQYDYYAVVPQDCAASWNQEAHAASLRAMASRFGVVCPAAEIMGAWSATR